MSDSHKKNIIIVLVDAFRPKNLSLYGYQKETDANIKKIAEDGIVFNNFFASSNATAPSLMTIFTGKLPSNHGIVHQFPYTKEEEIKKMYEERKFWLPSFLKSIGYKTIAIDWLGMFFEDGFDYYKEREEWQGELKVSTKFSPAADTMDLAIAKLKETDQPFFLFTHFWDTHFPFLTTEYQEANKETLEESLAKIASNEQKEFFRKRVTAEGNKVHSIDGMINKYDASIVGVDKQIGKLIQYLKDNNLWEDTIIFALGDHGVNLTEHGIYFSSASLFDDSIHVPAVAYLPGIEKKVVDGFVQNTDIVPTILEMIEEKGDWDFDGKSMIGLIKDNKEIHDKVVFWSGLEEDVSGFRTKDRKVITSKDNKCHLCKTNHHKANEEYDLINDKEENKNLTS